MAAPTFTQGVWQRPSGWRSPHRPLKLHERVDLAIVGAGIQGLSASLRAARQGLGVRVLEARSVGSGASGLNGGQVIPGLKYDPETLLERFGRPWGERIIAFAAGTAERVFDLIENERLDVPRRRDGWIQAAHTEKALAGLAARDRQWRERGANVGLLSAAEIRQMTGAEGYLGGWWERRAGAIDPLAFVCELARLASAAGVEIAENTPVTRLRSEGGGWTVETPDGVLRAKKVLVATNAYSEKLIPGLAQSLVWLHSSQVATAPLSPEQDTVVLPGGQSVSDSRRILVYYRKTTDGRLVVGGRGRMGQPRREADWAHLEHALHRLFPALKGLQIEKRWFGRVAMTPDHLPHIHEPKPGLLAAAGCQGRGVGLMTALGPRLADYLVTGDPDELPLPITPIRPIPLHPFRRLGAAGLIAWNRLLDARET
jgi:glycine/D-amino acid oxidase-like deaminating enzyme